MFISSNFQLVNHMFSKILVPTKIGRRIIISLPYNYFPGHKGNKGNKPTSVHILGDFNFCDIVWPDRLSKSGSPLSRSEGEKFIEILNDHHLEQLVRFPTREKNTLDLIIISLPSQFLDIQSPDRLSDHDIVS